MTTRAQNLPADSVIDAGAASSTAKAPIPAGWEELRDDPDIQFAPIDIPPPQPHEPGLIEQLLNAIFVVLGRLFGPIGQWLGSSWWWLQWVLLAMAIAFAAYLLIRTLSGQARKSQRSGEAEAISDWQPSSPDSLALLEEADRLAAEGRFDEATHLLLQRSIGQIAAARPDWVEPSSTARELTALPALSDSGRTAFAIIAERVERSLFALRELERADWEAARTAYADFARIRIDAPRRTRSAG